MLLRRRKILRKVGGKRVRPILTFLDLSITSHSPPPPCPCVEEGEEARRGGRGRRASYYYARREIILSKKKKKMRDDSLSPKKKHHVNFQGIPAIHVPRNLRGVVCFGHGASFKLGATDLSPPICFLSIHPVVALSGVVRLL